MQFDDVLEVIGSFGRYQKWVLFLMCVLKAHMGFLFLNAVFLLGIPEHRCSIPGFSNDTFSIQNDFHRELVARTIPKTDGTYDKCHVYKPINDTRYTIGSLDSEISLDMANMTTTVKCDKWVYDKSVYQETFVSQMDLVCDKGILVANAGMIFFLGMLMGSLVGGILSDRFGRKTVLLASILLNAAVSMANAWSSNYAMFLVMQLVKGGTAIVGYITAYILGMELTGKDKRVWPASVSNQAYVLGLMGLSGIAYGLRHWFWIQLVTALPGILFLSYWWLLPESPRWLLTRNRRPEAEVVIRKMAQWNRTRLPKGLLGKEAIIQDGSSTGRAGFFALFATKTLFLRSILIFFHWTVMAFLYYGLSLNAGNLSGDVYLNFALLGLVECPGYGLVTLLVDRLGRRKLYFSTMFIAGLACLSTLLTRLYAPDIDELTVVLAMVGKLFTTTASTVMYLYSAELFPTVARNAGMGCSSVAARVGAMAAPYLVVFGNTIGGTFGKSLPMILFGGVALLSAFLVLLLPETLNRNMPETVLEGDKIGKKKSALV